MPVRWSIVYGLLFFVVVVYVVRVIGLVNNWEGFLTTDDSNVGQVPPDTAAGNDILVGEKLQKRQTELLKRITPQTQSCDPAPNLAMFMVELAKDAAWASRDEASRQAEASKRLAAAQRSCKEVRLVSAVLTKVQAYSKEARVPVLEYRSIVRPLIDFQRDELKLTSDEINDVIGYPLAEGTSGEDINQSSGTNNREALIQSRSAYVRSVEGFVADVSTPEPDTEAWSSEYSHFLRGGNSLPLGAPVVPEGNGGRPSSIPNTTEVGSGDTPIVMPMRPDMRQRFVRLEEDVRQRRQLINSIFNRV